MLFCIIAVSICSAETITVQPLPASKALSTVAIIKDAQQNVPQMVSDAVKAVLGQTGFAAIIKQGDTVLIKPNLVAPATVAFARSMTDFRVVLAIVNLVKAAGASKIIIAEGSALNNTAAMRDSTGYTVANFPDVQFLDLNDIVNNPTSTMHLIDGCMGDDKQVLSDYVHANVVIGVPIMKTHQGNGVTGSLKNAFGIAPQPLVSAGGSNKAALHADIRKNIVDYNLCRKPDFLIMDALTGMEGNGPTKGTPITMNLVLASKDPVALDAVECSVMGILPYTISSIVLASNVNLGQIDLDKINVVGQSIADVKKVFVPAQSEVGYNCYRATNAVRKVHGPIVVDGMLSEWSDRNKILANTAEQVVGDIAKWTGPSACSFSARFLYDSANLYMAVVVKDTGKKINSQTDLAIQNGECVELYLSTSTQFGVNLTTSPDLRQTTYNNDYDYHIGFSHAATPANWVFSHGKALTNAEAKCVETDSGYIMELKIPWSNFNNFTLTRYRELGINVAVSNVNQSLNGCDYRIVWRPDSAINTDPTRMGLAYLTPLSDDEPVGIDGKFTFKESTIRTVAFRGVSLNFNSRSIKITYSILAHGNTGNFQMEIYDVKGKLIKTLKDNSRSKGPHEIVWDCRDRRGRAVSQGIFYCRLLAEETQPGIQKTVFVKPLAVYFN
jgi:uncharacterized protein (DUF362 family)